MGCYGSLSKKQIKQIVKEVNEQYPISIPVARKWSWKSVRLDDTTYYQMTFTFRAREQIGDYEVGSKLDETVKLYRAIGSTCSVYSMLGLLGLACFVGGVYLALSNLFVEKNNRSLGIGGIALSVIGIILSVVASIKHRIYIHRPIYGDIRQQYTDLLLTMRARFNPKGALTLSTPAPTAGITLNAEQFQQPLWPTSQHGAQAPSAPRMDAIALGENDRDLKKPLISNDMSYYN